MPFSSSTEATSSGEGTIASQSPALKVGIVALITNLAIWSVGAASGIEFAVTGPMFPEPITVGIAAVAVATVLATTLGGLILHLTRHRSDPWWRRLAIIGLIIGVVSMPIGLTASVATKLALSSVHLATGLIWYLLVRRVAR